MTTIETISGVSLILYLIVIFTSFYQLKKIGVSPVPTLPWVRKKIIGALKERLDSQGDYKIAELGCGWGGINLILARNFPNSSVTGYEISLFPYLFSKIRAVLCSNRITIVGKSFFDQDLSGFNVIICYLLPFHMEKLSTQLRNLAPETLIICNKYDLPGWEPVEVLHTYVGMDIPIYVYKV